MNRAAQRLGTYLTAIQCSVYPAAFALTAVFAPRVLLLEDETSSLSAISVIAAMTIASCIVHVRVALRPLRGALLALTVESPGVRPQHLMALSRVPGRLTVGAVRSASIAALITLLPWMRPATLDVATYVALVTLLLTMVSTAALSGYVAHRALIAHVLEAAPQELTDEALGLLGPLSRRRLRRRLAAAVAAPVAFVSLGASLLVSTHVRANERRAAAADVAEMVRIAFDEPSASDTLVQRRMGEVAARRGLRIHLHPEYAGAFVLQEGDEGTTRVVVPIGYGAAEVEFSIRRFSFGTAPYALLAAAAIVVAAVFGIRLGTAFESDVGLAVEEVRDAGKTPRSDMVIARRARFSVVLDLLVVVDAVRGVFREFARAQGQAIESRAGNERMRGFFLTSMSHDLKAPLNAILGFSELVGRNELTQGQRESLTIIDQRGRELLVLIDTILDSARVEAGEFELVLGPTCMGDVVMESVLDSRGLAQGTHVQIQGEVQPAMPLFLADTGRLKQALAGVIATAVRLSGDGLVLVRAMMLGAGEQVLLTVEASGTALPVAQRDQVVDVVTRMESARRYGALGLGLRLAQSIVELHGGQLRIDSSGNAGVTFRMSLPSLRQGTAPEGASEAASA